MEESKQQQERNLLLQIHNQQQMQQRQQQLLMMQHLHNQQQQQRPISLNSDANFRSSETIQNRPIYQFLRSPNPKPSSGANLMQDNKNFQQQEEEKSMRPFNQLEMQFAYQDTWRVCNPDFKRPFDSLEDACERLLPYHVVADYEAEEEDDIIFDLNTTSQKLSRSQQWNNNIATKIAEFTERFEKQAQDFNKITQKRSNGEFRCEERLLIEQALLQDERKACIDLKSELDREMNKAQQSHSEMMMMMMMARNQSRAENHGEQRRCMNPNEMMMMMNGSWEKQAQAQGLNVITQKRSDGEVMVEQACIEMKKAQQCQREMMMAREQFRGNVSENHGEQRRNINPYEMMNSSQRDEKEPCEDFLNDEENDEFDLNW